MKKRCTVPGLLLVAGTAMLCLAGRSRAADDIAYENSPPPAPVKEVWHYSGAGTGLFAKVGIGVWVESNNQGTFTFREVAREQNFVELYDQSREFTVRLYDDACSIRHRGTGGQFVSLYSRVGHTGAPDLSRPLRFDQ